jgi:hypothetical protein
MVLAKKGRFRFGCQEYNCLYTITNENLLKNILGDDLITPIIKNRKRYEFNTYLKSQGYKECVLPDCEQYAKLS